MAGHIQEGYEGSSIERWEVEHGITRVVRGGCEYVICRDWELFKRKNEEERARARREYIAEQQAAAYVVGG